MIKEETEEIEETLMALMGCSEGCKVVRESNEYT